MNQHAHHTARRITAAAIGLALSCAGLGSQAVAYATQPAATDVTVIAFQQNWKTVAEECTNTYGPEGANLAAAKFYFTDGTGTDRPDGNGWYQSQVGDTMVNVQDGTVSRGVPFTRTYASQHANQTKVTINFKPTSSVGTNATGVQVWTDDQAVYIPFGATPNGFGKTASGYVDGTQSQVKFRIVDDRTATAASNGTEDSYTADVWKLDKFANAYVDGAIEAWVDGNQPQTVSDRSPEKASPAATPQPNDIKNPKTLTVKLHYYRADGRYQDYDMESDTWKGWDLWSWYKESTSGVATPFNGHDDFGEVAEYTLSQTGKGVRDPWFIIRNGGSSWTGKDCDDNDRQIPESVINMSAGDLAAGTAEFWILSGDPTVYAHPVAATGVTFDSQGGSPIGAQTVELGGTASEPVAPTKDGFKFVRWTTDVAGIQPYDFNSEVTAPVTLYAQWAVAHKVTFDSTGGSAVDTQLVGDGEKASAPANPTRTGYTFAGWRTDATGGAAYDFNTAPVTGDVTLYAEWTRTSHPVDHQVRPQRRCRSGRKGSHETVRGPEGLRRRPADLPNRGPDERAGARGLRIPRLEHRPQRRARQERPLVRRERQVADADRPRWHGICVVGEDGHSGQAADLHFRLHNPIADRRVFQYRNRTQRTGHVRSGGPSARQVPEHRFRVNHRGIRSLG